jgi:hypothetical protein
MMVRLLKLTDTMPYVICGPDLQFIVVTSKDY